MVLEAERREQRLGVDVEDLPRRAARIERDHDGDEAADDERVAVAAKFDARPAVIRAHRLLEPDLAGAALHLVDVVMRLRRKRRQRAAELDQIAIAILP